LKKGLFLSEQKTVDRKQKIIQTDSMRSSTTEDEVSNSGIDTPSSEHHFFAEGVQDEDKEYSVLASLDQLPKDRNTPQPLEGQHVKNNSGLSKVTITKGNTTITIEGDKPSTIRCDQDGVVIVGNDGSIQEIRSTSPLIKASEDKKLSQLDYDKELVSSPDRDLEQEQFKVSAKEVDLTMCHSNQSQIMNIMPDISTTSDSAVVTSKSENAQVNSNRKKSTKQRKIKANKIKAFGKRRGQIHHAKWQDRNRHWEKRRSKFSRHSKNTQRQQRGNTAVQRRQRFLQDGPCQFANEQKMWISTPDTMKQNLKPSTPSFIHGAPVSISSSSTTDDQSRGSHKMKDNCARDSVLDVDNISSPSSLASSYKKSNISAIPASADIYQQQNSVPFLENDHSDKCIPGTGSVSTSGYTSSLEHQVGNLSLSNEQHGIGFNYKIGFPNLVSKYRPDGRGQVKRNGQQLSSQHKRKFQQSLLRKHYKQRREEVGRKKKRKPGSIKHHQPQRKNKSTGIYHKKIKRQKWQGGYKRNNYGSSYRKTNSFHSTSLKPQIDVSQIKKGFHEEDASGSINDLHQSKVSPCLLNNVVEKGYSGQRQTTIRSIGDRKECEGKEVRRIDCKGAGYRSQAIKKKRGHHKPFKKRYVNYSIDDKSFKQHVAKIIQNIVRKHGAHLSVIQQSDIIKRVCEKIAKTFPKRWSLKNLNRINRASLVELAKKYVDYSTRN